MLLRVDGDGVANRCRGEKLRCWKRWCGGGCVDVSAGFAKLVVVVAERSREEGNGVAMLLRWYCSDLFLAASGGVRSSMEMVVAWWMLAFAAAMEKMVREGCCWTREEDGGAAAAADWW